MISTKFSYTLKVHNSVYPIHKYLFNTIELHYKDMNIINWQVGSSEKKAIHNDKNHYQTDVVIEITIKQNQDLFNVKSRLFIILSLDPNLEILRQECDPKDIYA
jgi:hypothetical protein